MAVHLPFWNCTKMTMKEVPLSSVFSTACNISIINACFQKDAIPLSEAEMNEYPAMIWTRKRHLCLCHVPLSRHTKTVRLKTVGAVYALILCILSLLLLLTMTGPSQVLLGQHPWLLQWRADQVPVTPAPTPSPVLQPDCQGLLQGDQEEASITKQMLYAETRTTVPDEYFISITQNCTLYIRTKQYVNVAVSAQEESFPVAFVITVHRNMQQLEQLLSAIYIPHNVYCIHVDAKSPREFRQAVEGVSHCYHNIFVASRSESVISGGFSRLQADINCMQELLASNMPWKYVINLEGQDFPLKTNLEVMHYLRSLNGTNEIPGVVPMARLQTDKFRYVHTTAFGSIQRTSHLKLPVPDNITIQFGSAHYFASRAFVQHALSDVTAQRLLAWFQDVQNPEEFYWATLQRLPHTPGGNADPGWAKRLRTVKWTHATGGYGDFPAGHALHAQGQRRACVYGVESLHWLTRQPQLFASKFDLDVDHVVLHCLLTWLRDKVKQQQQYNTTM